MTSRGLGRLAAGCGLAAPASFVTAWAVAGALRSGYDPVHEAISQLAREGSSNRLAMTAGFVSFGLLLPVFAQHLPPRIGAGTALRVAITVAGVSTLGVAAYPLQQEAGGAGDARHAVAAGIGYVAMVASPALAAVALRRSGRPAAAAASVAVSLVSAAALTLSVTAGPTGLWQRVGLTVVDAWFAVAGLWSLSRADLARPRAARSPKPQRRWPAGPTLPT